MKTHTPKILHIPFYRLLICLAIVSLLTGCGAGSGQGLDEDGNLMGTGGTGGGSGGGGGGSGGASGNPNATLSWIQSNVFGGVCSQCHTGAGAPMGVNWSTETNSCTNVGRTSAEIPTLKEIESGNPDRSHVIWKVEGAAPTGQPETYVPSQMPLNNTPLSSATIQNMRDWISDGTPGCQAPRPVDSIATRSSRVGSNEPERGSTYPPGSWMYVWNESMRICTLCHSITPASPRCSLDLECPPNGLVLTADNYFGVVDGNTVAPFDLDRSILWKRVTENHSKHQMPSGFESLNPKQLDIIRNWIEDGAPFCPENVVCP